MARDVWVLVRSFPEEKERWQALASGEGQTLSDLVRGMLDARCGLEKIVEVAEEVEKSADDGEMTYTGADLCDNCRRFGVTCKKCREKTKGKKRI